MKAGTSKNTTCKLRYPEIGKDAMMERCRYATPEGYDHQALYDKWCKEIDHRLEDNKHFWHTPCCSELDGPIDSEITLEEFREIMDTTFAAALARLIG